MSPGGKNTLVSWPERVNRPFAPALERSVFQALEKRHETIWPAPKNSGRARGALLGVSDYERFLMAF